MKISLWGYYGFNYGDDIMMNLFLKELEEKDVQVILIDSHNGNLKEKVNNTNVQVIEYWKLTKFNKIKMLFKLARETKLNIWGGGTVFTDVDNDGNFLNFILLKLFGGKIGYISVGIGEIKKTSRKIKTKLLIKLSNLISLRDKKSFEYSRNINPKISHYSEDVTYYYFQNFNTKTDENKDYLLISFRKLSKYYDEARELSLANQLISIIPDFMNKNNLSKIVLLPLDKQDNDINKYIADSLSNSFETTMLTTTDVDEMTGLIKNSSIYISGRLHGSVASEFFDISTLTLSYSNKIEFFYSSINKHFIDLNKEGIDHKKVYQILENNKKAKGFKHSENNAYQNIELIYNYIK